MSKKILIVQGHPNSNSLLAAMAQTYADAARTAGAEVRMTHVCEMSFDPNLALGYTAEQALEPDLQQFQQDILWAEHVLWAFPMWWGSMPAIMKGLIDRALLPGFAFKFHEGKMMQEKLLKGRTSSVFVVMDTPGFFYRWYFGRGLHRILKNQILGFVGFSKIRMKMFGGVGHSTPEKRAKWLEWCANSGRKMA